MVLVAREVYTYCAQPVLRACVRQARGPATQLYELYFVVVGCGCFVWGVVVVGMVVMVVVAVWLLLRRAGLTLDARG